jgi:hypothetical protein
MRKINTMPSDYLPNDGESFCEWLENFKIEFAAIAASLGFKPAEIAAILADIDWSLYVCRAAADASSHASAWVQFRESLLSGDGNTPLGSAPLSANPEAPEAAAPAQGSITRIRAAVKRLKGAPAYTTAIGQSLRIVGNVSAEDPATAKPALRVKPLPLFQAELRWPRRGYSGVLVQSQRDGETDWTDHGVKTDNVFVDARPPAETNKPELRRYRQIYVKNDQPVGLWSDVVSVTVQP